MSLDLLLNKVETFIQHLLLCVQSVIKKADEYQQTLDNLQESELFQCLPCLYKYL